MPLFWAQRSLHMPPAESLLRRVLLSCWKWHWTQGWWHRFLLPASFTSLFTPCQHRKLLRLFFLEGSPLQTHSDAQHGPPPRNQEKQQSCFISCFFFFSFKLNATDCAVGAIHECPNPKVGPENQLFKYLSAHLLHPSRID